MGRPTPPRLRQRSRTTCWRSSARKPTFDKAFRGAASRGCRRHGGSAVLSSPSGRRQERVRPVGVRQGEAGHGGRPGPRFDGSTGRTDAPAASGRHRHVVLGGHRRLSSYTRTTSSAARRRARHSGSERCQGEAGSGGPSSVAAKLIDAAWDEHQARPARFLLGQMLPAHRCSPYRARTTAGPMALWLHARSAARRVRRRWP